MFSRGKKIAAQVAIDLQRQGSVRKKGFTWEQTCTFPKYERELFQGKMSDLYYKTHALQELKNLLINYVPKLVDSFVKEFGKRNCSHQIHLCMMYHILILYSQSK